MSNEKIPMSHPIDEQVSAFVDDELDPRELPMFTAQVAHSPELRRRLARYALIGNCLRGDLRPATSGLMIADRVRAALDDEPAAAPAPVALPVVRPGAAWRRPALGVAAGIAIAAALLLNLPTGPVPQQEPMATALAPAATAPVVASLPAAVPAPRPQVQRPVTAASQRPTRADVRMTNYLVYHGEYAGMLSSRAVASRIVDQDSGTRWVRQAVLTDD